MAGSGVPRASEAYFVTAGVSGGICALSALIAILLDVSAYEELYPEPDTATP